MPTIFAATMMIVTLTGFGIFGIAQGQTNLTSSSITPEQKTSICNPDNPKLNFVNTTESKLCGIPKTIKNTTSTITATSTTTGTQTPSSSAVPSS